MYGYPREFWVTLPPMEQAVIAAVAACPDRGGSLPVSVQPECGCAELYECRAGQGGDPGPGDDGRLHGVETRGAVPGGRGVIDDDLDGLAAAARGLARLAAALALLAALGAVWAVWQWVS